MVEKKVQPYFWPTVCCSTVVELLTTDHDIKGSNPASLCLAPEDMAERKDLAFCCTTATAQWAEHLTTDHEMKGSNLASF